VHRSKQVPLQSRRLAAVDQHLLLRFAQEFDEEAENQPPLGAALQPLPGTPNGHAAKPPLQVPCSCVAEILTLPVIPAGAVYLYD
jgi:hypothetical protein